MSYVWSNTDFVNGKATLAFSKEAIAEAMAAIYHEDEQKALGQLVAHEIRKALHRQERGAKSPPPRPRKRPILTLKKP